MWDGKYIRNINKFSVLYINWINKSFNLEYTIHIPRVTRRVPLVEQGTAYTSEHLNSSRYLVGVRVTRSLVLYVLFCRSCVPLSFLFLPLNWLSFFDLRIMITSVVSSNSSWIHNSHYIEFLTFGYTIWQRYIKKIKPSTSFDDISFSHAYMYDSIT
jgi:hypothetical protein